MWNMTNFLFRRRDRRVSDYENGYLTKVVARDALRQLSKKNDDGSVTVMVRCYSCGDEHEQMYQHAVGLLMNDRYPLCIKCDPDANK